MSHYIQLLGSDTPNGYGGCCYYGPLDHSSLQELPTSTTTNPPHATSAISLHLAAPPHTTLSHISHTDPTPHTRPSSQIDTSTRSQTATTIASSVVASTDLDATPAWNWSSYLTAPRPTWPTSGPLHSYTVLHPAASGRSSDRPSALSSGTTTDGAAASGAPFLPLTADTGSSGSEGYIFFNCPEGTQRFSSEANIKLKKVRCFCFTRWNSTTTDTADTTADKHLRAPGALRKDGDDEMEKFSADEAQHSSEACSGDGNHNAAVGAASAAMGLPGMLFTINDAGSRQATFFGPSSAFPPSRQSKEAGAASAMPQVCSASCSRDASTGLRGFLSALRFHYFQYRPMVFRQLHGVAPHATPKLENLTTTSSKGPTAAAATTTPGNEVHYTEIAGDVDEKRGEAASAAEEPFFHATIPLSSQSLLVAFRISAASSVVHQSASNKMAASREAVDTTSSALSNTADFRTSSIPKSAATSVTAIAAAAAAEQLSPFLSTRSCDNAESTNAPGQIFYAAPDSSRVVLGYAIVVSPGASFDAAKARELGVRSGPKYGQLKQGIAVLADPAEDTTQRSAKKNKTEKPPKGQESVTNANAALPKTSSDDKKGEPIHVPVRDVETRSAVVAEASTPTTTPVEQRWVHPYEVMRPTVATKHAYVSLVLDSDAPEDVQQAMTTLLGSNERRGSVASTNASAAGAEGSCSGGSGGALLQLLRTHFPHLAYYASDDDDNDDLKENVRRGNGEKTDGSFGVTAPSFTQRPRQLTVRHVAHLQPASYFDDFRRRGYARGSGMRTPHDEECEGDRQAGDGGDEQQRAAHGTTGTPEVFHTSPSAQPPPSTNVYAEYNRYIFANVASQSSSSSSSKRSSGSGAVLSLDPALSFTLQDLAEEDGEIEESNAKVTVSTSKDAQLECGGVAKEEPLGDVHTPPTPAPRHTWQLYTSYVQQHFTAFPTALVHRYHLHHLAPTLFPLRGCGAGDAEDSILPVDVHRSEGEKRQGAQTGETAGAAAIKESTAPIKNTSATLPSGEVEYWPYSLKLRCVPETALQFQDRRQSKSSAKLAIQAKQTHTASSPTAVAPESSRKGKDGKSEEERTEGEATATAVNAAAAAAAASAGPVASSPPWKREKKEPNDNCAANASSGAPSTLSATTSKEEKCGAARAATSPSAVASSGKAANKPGVSRQYAPSSAPRHLAVVDGQTSLLPYPTPSSALGLLSADFLRTLKANTAAVGDEVNVTHREGFVSAAAVAQDGEVDLVGTTTSTATTAAAGGGALGFLGTGSAVPSKYRNVSGTYLELHLPAYCFGEHNDDDSGDDDQHHNTNACDDVHRQEEEAEEMTRSGTSAAVRGDAGMTTSCQRLRRGVVVLDFGEGSAGQLRSLCEGAREGVGAARLHADQTSTRTTPATAMMTTCPSAATQAQKSSLLYDEESDSVVLPAVTPATQRADVGLDGNAVDDRLRKFVMDVVLIFISHAHADHHLGLLSLLTLRHHYLTSYETHAARTKLPKLLVVCPAEVYQFLMDAWGSTAPYNVWLHEECIFDLMPPPLRAMGANTPANGADGAADTTNVEGGRLSTSSPKMDDAADTQRLLLEASADMSGRRCGHQHHNANGWQEPQQHVVPMPLLQAQLKQWNACIAQQAVRHLHTTQRNTTACEEESRAKTVVPAAEPTSNEKKQGATVLQELQMTNSSSRVSAPARSQSSMLSRVWWAAEVITVDHPANAHALLLRFPFCSTPHTLPPTDKMHNHPSTLAREAEKEEHLLTWEKATASSRESVVPDESRVFLFSGDTRPSSFLVERSHRFTGLPPSPPPPSPDAATTPPVFILLHEATFGPGFEGEAIRKKHSTLPEALQIGAAVQAEFVVLNHFSQRYPKLPGLSEEQLGGRSTTLVCQRRPRTATAATAEADEENDVRGEVNDTTAETISETHNEEEKRCLEVTAPQASHQVEGRSSQDPRAIVDAAVEKDDGDAEATPAPSTSSKASPPPQQQDLQPQQKPSVYANMSFAFDLMSVSFTAMHRGLVPRLTPALVRLLEEYDSWGVSTTHRMRTARPDSHANHNQQGGGKGGSSSKKK